MFAQKKNPCSHQCNSVEVVDECCVVHSYGHDVYGRVHFIVVVWDVFTVVNINCAIFIQTRTKYVYTYMYM